MCSSADGIRADFHVQGLAEHTLERGGMPSRGPELELRIARCPKLEQPVVAAIVQLEARHGLRVAAIEAFGQAQDRRQRPNGPPALAAELAIPFMAALWRRLAMIPGHERNRLDFVRLEAAEIAIPDEVIRVLVMALVADMHADIVQ
jgi:hypothetical protein